MTVLGPVAALCLVLAAIWGLQALLRRRLRPEGGPRLQLSETIALDARRRLHLIRCDDRFLLIATGAAQDLVAGWLPAPAAPSAAPPAAPLSRDPA